MGRLGLAASHDAFTTLVLVSSTRTKHASVHGGWRVRGKTQVPIRGCKVCRVQQSQSTAVRVEAARTSWRSPRFTTSCTSANRSRACIGKMQKQSVVKSRLANKGNPC